MPTPFLPYQRDPIAGELTTPNNWYAFFSSLRQFLVDSGLDTGVIDDILSRLTALEEEEQDTFLIQGLVSVSVFGTPANGFVRVELLNDVDSPGNTYYYGTGQDGTKGWFTVASTLAQGDGIILTVGADGVTTIAHADTSSVADLTSDNANGVVIQDYAITFDTFGHVQTVSVGTADMWTLPASSYRTLVTANSIITAGSAAGTYAMTSGGDGCVLSGANTAIPIQTIYIDSADYPTIGTLATKLRIRVQFYTNDTAPTGDYTFGLYPVTRPATSGGSGVNIYDLGTVVTGSNGASFSAPAADGLLNAASADFALPANGHYVIGVLTTAAPAANSNIQLTASLQMRNA